MDSAPVAGSLNSDSEHVFAIHDNQLYQKWWSSSEGWSDWIINLGTPAAGFTGGLTTICRNSGACNVYVRGLDNALWQLPYYDGVWHPWIRHDDNFRLDSAPVAGSLNNDSEHVFAVHDNQLYQKWWSSSEGWSGWINLGAPSDGFSSDLTTICRNSGACNVYVRGNFSFLLWQLAYYDGVWHPWIRHDVNFSLDSAPAAGSLNSDSEHVFIIHKGQLYQKWWTP